MVMFKFDSPYKIYFIFELSNQVLRLSKPMGMNEW